mmetsp:Transcript_5171/g.7273  ORF Transcript_5171/g.7273 Transcript_5171/m.7273 type:complete len:130 (+) Transcript_5171:27-416(+)
MSDSATPLAEPEQKPSAKKGNQCEKCHLATDVPTIPMYGPYNLRLEKGKTYSWCSCGKSKTQPWCDGSHKGTTFKSVRFVADKNQTYYSICGCKYTRDPPYCDGYHASLPYKPDFSPCSTVCNKPTTDW